MKKMISCVNSAVSSSLVVLTLLFSLNTLAAAEKSPCGLSGKLSKRIRDCQKVVAQESKKTYIYISRKDANDPLYGIDESQSASVWVLVSRRSNGDELWLSRKDNQLWMNLPLTYSEPVPSFIFSSIEMDCEKLAEIGFHLHDQKWSTPTLQHLQDANDGGLNLVLHSGGVVIGRIDDSVNHNTVIVDEHYLSAYQKKEVFRQNISLICYSNAKR